MEPQAPPHWPDYIVTTPDTLFGKPRFAGTRIAIEHILTCLAGGWTMEEIHGNYPQVTPEHIRALFEMIREDFEDGTYFLSNASATSSS